MTEESYKAYASVMEDHLAGLSLGRIARKIGKSTERVRQILNEMRAFERRRAAGYGLLSARAYHGLCYEGLITGDLLTDIQRILRTDDRSLLRIRNFGVGCLANVRAWAASFGDDPNPS